MKQLFANILKIILLIFLFLLVLLLVFGGVLSLGWPWWVGFFVLTGLTGLLLGVLTLKKILLRRKEQKFVHQVMEQDQSYLKTLNQKEREKSLELQDCWKEAMDALKSSHLKKHGDPLYVLPWYMVIGESGSGKTSAIKGADLSSPFAEVGKASGISDTRNCDWWFFEQAIIIDTAGRYAIPVNEERDKDEWQNFLSLLSRFRKKEPLNGLVVTIAADKLLKPDLAQLEADGNSIRQRIDELMRVLGARFPIYLLVTKCDLIEGMSRFCDALGESGHDQAMGVINDKFSQDIIGFITSRIDAIVLKLKDLRLLLLQKKSRWQKGPSLIFFPEEFEKIKTGLEAFAKGAFQENPFQETALLRGLFFSSGCRQETQYSPGLIQNQEVSPPTNKGIFLHDFFAKILPRDRGLFVPTQRKLEWSRLTKNLGLTAWLAICIALCGLLSFSFVKNLKTLRDVSTQFSRPQVLSGELLADTILMDRFREAVISVENQNKSWWIPRFGLTESIQIENKLKDKYIKQFSNGFLSSFDKKMADAITNFSTKTPSALIGIQVAHLVKRINLLRAEIDGRSLMDLQAIPQPVYDPLLIGSNQILIPEIRDKISHLYLYSLIWQNDKSRLNQQMNQLQIQLKYILTINGLNLNWLAIWAETATGLKPVLLNDFWQGIETMPQPNAQPKNQPENKIAQNKISAAFTTLGKGKIDNFLNKIETALFDPLIIARQKQAFKKWYTKEYIKSWYEFAAVFPAGRNALKSPERWKQIAKGVGSNKGPYFSLLEDMAKALAVIELKSDSPAWLNLVFEIETLRQEAAFMQTEKSKQAGIFEKAAGKVKSTMAKVEKKTGLKTPSRLNQESLLISAKALLSYQEALAQIKEVVFSRNLAFEMGSAIYSDDPVTSKSPFFIAQNGLNQFKTTIGYHKNEEEVIWHLMQGPLNYFHEFILKETACYLQNVWEKEVLLEIQDVSAKQDLNRLLMGKDGYAVRFIKGVARPFINRTLRKGYYAKKVIGKQVAFNKSFMGYLTKGAKAARPIKESYSVSVKAYPTDVNKDAKIKPHATILELECASKKLRLVNQQYPVGKIFNWSMQNCGDVLFQIKVGNLILTKKYTGYQAFPKFLNDFKQGKRIFFTSEFSDKSLALERMGIKYITVKYKFKGHKPVLRLLHAVPGNIPQQITICWDF